MGESAQTTHPYLQGGGEMGDLIRAHNWSATPLGPPDKWPQSLRSAVSILLPSRAQICMFWGPDLITIYNDAYRPTLGVKHPWALGQPVREVWKELWEDFLRSIFGKIIATGTAFWASDHLFFLERHGFPEETYYDVSYDPIRDESGNVGGLFCIVSETTGRVIGERRLRTLRGISQVATEAQTSDDAFQRVACVLSDNAHDLPFALLYDRPSDGRLARCVAACGIEAMDAGMWPLAQAAQRKEALTLAGDQLPEGARSPAGPWPEPVNTAVVLPLSGTGKSPHGFLVAGVSPRLVIDDQYRDFLRLVASNTAAAVGAAQTLAEERERAQALAELDRAKTLFFSNISHEFRTPLTLMLGPVEDALNDRVVGLPEPQRDRLDLAHRNAVRLLKLVNSLLDFSRIESGRIEATFSLTDLGAVTAEIASSFRSAIERAGLRFVVDCRPTDDPIYLDREMWEKIVLNLLSNAFKFTFEGTIEVQVRPTEGGAVLTVRDTGTGIAPDHLPHLFERFYRVPNAKSRTHEGSGIGLALVHELVKLHKGEIAVDSAPDRGTSISIILKSGTEHLPADRIEATRTLDATPARREAFVEEALKSLPDGDVSLVGPHERLPLPGDSRPARILWADDNSDMRDYVKRLLSPYWTVEAVADGMAALDRARQSPPDIVLADVMMPKLDGFELLRNLRNDDQTRSVPVILLSARAGEEAKIEGLDAGADDYLIKPFSARELIARIRTHLEMSRVREEMAAKQYESDAWLNVAVKAARLGIWFADPSTWDAGGDSNLMRILGLPLDRRQLSAAEWQDLIYPEDRDRSIQAFAATAEGKQPLDLELRIRQPHGEVRWLAVHGNLVPKAGRASGRIVGVSQDITEHKSLVERQQLLLNELNHRVRNTLSTVISLAKQTSTGAGTIQDFVGKFQARILALAGAHGLLTRRNWEAVALREVIEETLAPHQGNGSFKIVGPECDLYARHALALTLGFHELATNACKYGALSAPSGHIEIVWDARPHDRGKAVRVTWSEHGGPLVNPPSRRGFGSTLIERALALDLDGEVNLKFEPAGVRCNIAFLIEERKHDATVLH